MNQKDAIIAALQDHGWPGPGINVHDWITDLKRDCYTDGYNDGYQDGYIDMSHGETLESS